MKGMMKKIDWPACADEAGAHEPIPHAEQQPAAEVEENIGAIDGDGVQNNMQDDNTNVEEDWNFLVLASHFESDNKWEVII